MPIPGLWLRDQSKRKLFGASYRTVPDPHILDFHFFGFMAGSNLFPHLLHAEWTEPTLTN